MARQQLDPSLEAEQERLQKLWDAYRAQEDELIAVEKDLESVITKNETTEVRLRKEEERLQKLWDAYRAQEQELEELKENVPLMEEKLVERERTIKSLERDVAVLEPLTKKGKVATELETENERLKTEVDVLRSKLKTTGASAGTSGDMVPAKDLKKAEKDLGKEQERLKKLYALYQDQEEDVEHLKKVISEWEAWAKKVRPALEA